MFRELVQIILAIHLSANKLPEAKVCSFANIIQQKAVDVDIDPLMFVAIIKHESNFNEHAVSKDQEDCGLMQVRKRYYRGSAESLLIGENSIRVGAYLIKEEKDYCRERLKREPDTEEWLSLYQGTKIPCKANKLTKMFVDYTACLKEAVERDAETDGTFECDKIYWKR